MPTGSSGTDPDETDDENRPAENADGISPGTTADETCAVLEGWPVALHGVTESLVTTLGPNERWNVAALGLHAPDVTLSQSVHEGRAETWAEAPAVTARTWGRTRTWRNFHEQGGGYVQFVRDPVRFVEAALSVVERDDQILPEADAWVEVTVDSFESGTVGETRWEDWALYPQTFDVRTRVVPTINRGHAAVIEATVAASRLDVTEFDTATLRARIDHLEGVVDRCGGPAERVAFDRLRDILANDE